MRAVILYGMFILGISFFLIAPPVTIGQGKKGQFGFGGGGFDAGAYFDQFSNGRQSIPVTEVKTMSKDVLMQFLQEKSITNGMVSRQQYIDYAAYSKARREAGGGGKGGNRMFPGANPTGDGNGGMFPKIGNPGDKPGPGQGAGPGIQLTVSPPVNVDFIKQLAEASFNKLDENKDGFLNEAEMPRDLKTQLGQWDANKDGLVDLKEYREFFTAQFTGRGRGNEENPGAGSKEIPDLIIDERILDQKAVVFRAGAKLPMGLPGWFKELDTDPVDGQVALNEWREGSKAIDEFKTWDLNDDGFITIEEALRGSVGANAASLLNGAASSSNGSDPLILIQK